MAFEVDGRPAILADEAAVRTRVGRHPAWPAWRTPSARPLPPSAIGTCSPGPDGIAISTFGMVFKRGWDWLGLGPTAAADVAGLIEAPDLAGCLTLNKNDFIRSGARGATYLAYRKAIQEVVARQLAQWGDARDGEVKPRVARLDRELERVLEDLAEDFPLLRSLVDRRTGGQRRLPMPDRGGARADTAVLEPRRSRCTGCCARGSAAPSIPCWSPRKAGDDRLRSDRRRSGANETAAVRARPPAADPSWRNGRTTPAGAVRVDGAIRVEARRSRAWPAGR